MNLAELRRFANNNPSGVLGAYDELPAWTFGGGAAANAQDQAALRKLWAGGDLPVRVGKIELPPQSPVSIVGAVSFEALAARGRSGAGALDRWLWVYPDRAEKARIEERSAVPESILADWTALLFDLRFRFADPKAKSNDRPIPRVVRLAPEALEAFRRRGGQHAERADDPAFPEALRGAHAALEIYAARFCLLLGVLRDWKLARDPAQRGEIGPETVEAAWDLVAYFGTQADRIRIGLSGDRDSMPDGARWILAWMRRNPGTTVISESELTRCYAPSRGYSRCDLGAGLDWLARRSALRRIPAARPSGVPGRKPSICWEVHPEFEAEEVFS
jgi:hypothetical protein